MPTWLTTSPALFWTSTRKSAWANAMSAQGSVLTTSGGQTALYSGSAIGQEASPFRMSISRLIQFSISTCGLDADVNAAAFLGDGHVAVPQRRAGRDRREATRSWRYFPPKFQNDVGATVVAI